MSFPLKKEYRNNQFQDRMHVYPIRRVQTSLKKKKKNPFKVAMRFVCISSYLSLFSYFAAPYLCENYFRPLVASPVLNSSIKYDVKSKVDISANYLSNSSIFNEKILSKNTSLSSDVEKLKSNGEIFSVRRNLERLSRYYPNVKPSVFVWDYNSAKSVEISPDSLYSSASIVKIPILFELFRKIERDEKSADFYTSLNKELLYTDLHRTLGSGKLQYSKMNTKHSVDHLARIMITQSDNSSSNMLLDEVGGKKYLDSTMKSYGLDKITIENRLPDLEGKNKTTARQMATLLYNLDNSKYLSPKSRGIIKEYMSNVENTNLLKAGLPKGAQIIHKTGDIGTMLGDAGIVYTESGNKYIVVILVNRKFNDYAAKEYITKASSIIYKALNSKSFI